MGNYHAEIVNLSLKNKKMIKEYVILKCRKRFWGLCKIYTIIIPERDIDDAVKYSLQGTTQGNGLTGGVPPVRFSM